MAETYETNIPSYRVSRGLERFELKKCISKNTPELYVDIK